MPVRPDPEMSQLIQDYLASILDAKGKIVTRDSEAVLGACVLAAVHMAQGKPMPKVHQPPARVERDKKKGIDPKHPVARHITPPTGLKRPRPQEPARAIDSQKDVR